jgi:hypothetical protein
MRKGERACEFRKPSPAKLLDKGGPQHARRSIGRISRNGIVHCLPFSLCLSHPTDQLLSILSSTCAEDLHFLAVNIMLRLRIDCFELSQSDLL